MKPKIAISMGDPAGISPEIIADSLEAACCIATPVVFGHLPTMREVMDDALRDRIVVLEKPGVVPDGRIGFVSIRGGGDTPIDIVDDRCARAQFESLEYAVDAVLGGALDALVTAPVAKNAIAEVSPGFTGHTEYLATRAGLAKDDVTMVFVSPLLAVGMVSTHIPLKDVPGAVTLRRLDRTYRHVLRTCQRKETSQKPRIGIAALNPHAGEDGLFGTEEAALLKPFCKDKAVDIDATVVGPLPADAIFRDALNGGLDGVVALYHDQALIPLKLGGVGQMVNLTMGLPFIRTSPDHGVAYDIARTGKADASGMKLAIALAVEMTEGIRRKTSDDVF